MHFPGRFREHILPDHLESLSLSFLVDSLERRPGGIAANIAYSMALLGERPRIMATVGEDFEDYRRALESVGVVTDEVRVIPGLLTASFFVTTDDTDSQIASFYTGAMAHATELSFADLDPPPDLVLISPNDPAAMITYVDECIELGISYFFDPSQQILLLDSAALETGIRGCEALFANEYELALIKDKTSLTIDDITEMTKFTVITRGEDGSDLYTREGRQHIAAIPPREAAEPTGVGDSYRAGFLKGYLEDLPLECCGMMGALAATYSLEQTGPQSHKFDLAEFIARFRSEYDSDCDLDRLLS
ncbi:MAG: carbohydrate kinase family protein [Chloroflexi bacterium]|nr:carbohydrate kinase family protein [Chloroflexota bacterium]MCI0877092.1 carbohydrate kinase family protein [Chloroflexota bacterium]